MAEGTRMAVESLPKVNKVVSRKRRRPSAGPQAIKTQQRCQRPTCVAQQGNIRKDHIDNSLRLERKADVGIAKTRQ
eukprot:gene4952-5601_t